MPSVAECDQRILADYRAATCQCRQQMGFITDADDAASVRRGWRCYERQQNKEDNEGCASHAKSPFRKGQVKPTKLREEQSRFHYTPLRPKSRSEFGLINVLRHNQQRGLVLSARLVLPSR
jgi:hypothetical protein